MNAREETNHEVPVAAGSAPLVRLVSGVGTSAETAIKCRRVVTLLGSREGCKVRLQHRLVSPVHAAIIINGAEVLAVDLVTPHGVRLNELKLEHERLRSGDRLAVDPWEFRVDMVARPKDGESTHPFGLEPAPQVIALEHVASRRILQPTRDICIIGRRQGCDIAISDTSVSRVHALLFAYFGFPAIFDLLTKNGTHVNDEAVSFKLLTNGDLISIGESRFRVRLAGSSVSEQVEKGSNGRAAIERPLSAPPTEDLIDIKATEGSQRWRIADSVDKAARKS